MTTDICYFRVPWSYEKDLNTKICTGLCLPDASWVVRCVVACIWHHGGSEKPEACDDNRYLLL